MGYSYGESNRNSYTCTNTRPAKKMVWRKVTTEKTTKTSTTHTTNTNPGAEDEKRVYSLAELLIYRVPKELQVSDVPKGKAKAKVESESDVDDGDASSTTGSGDTGSESGESTDNAPLWRTTSKDSSSDDPPPSSSSPATAKEEEKKEDEEEESSELNPEAKVFVPRATPSGYRAKVPCPPFPMVQHPGLVYSPMMLVPPGVHYYMVLPPGARAPLAPVPASRPLPTPFASIPEEEEVVETTKSPLPRTSRPAWRPVDRSRDQLRRLLRNPMEDGWVPIQTLNALNLTRVGGR